MSPVVTVRSAIPTFDLDSRSPGYGGKVQSDFHHKSHPGASIFSGPNRCFHAAGTKTLQSLTHSSAICFSNHGDRINSKVMSPVLYLVYCKVSVFSRAMLCKIRVVLLPEIVVLTPAQRGKVESFSTVGIYSPGNKAVLLL